MTAAHDAFGGNGVAIHGHAVQVGRFRHVCRDVDVSTNQHSRKDLAKRDVVFLVSSDFVQQRERVFILGILHVLHLQTIQRQKRHAPSFFFVQVLDNLTSDVVIINDDLK